MSCQCYFHILLLLCDIYLCYRSLLRYDILWCLLRMRILFRGDSVLLSLIYCVADNHRKNKADPFLDETYHQLPIPNGY